MTAGIGTERLHVSKPVIGVGLVLHPPRIRPRIPIPVPGHGAPRGPRVPGTISCRHLQVHHLAGSFRGVARCASALLPVHHLSRSLAGERFATGDIMFVSGSLFHFHSEYSLLLLAYKRLVM
eukprot:scaffold361_cov248-Pinguiococcus_pyrenoidosus.AAC.12